MKRLASCLICLVPGPLLWGANLKIDASKTSKPKLIQPAKYQVAPNEALQNKRYKAPRIEKKHMDIREKPFVGASAKASDTISRIDGLRRDLGEQESPRQTRVLDQVITSSEAFEKAYREALKIELSKRAAAQVEVAKIKRKKLSQREINRDAKARQADTQGISVQRAGSSEP